MTADDVKRRWGESDFIKDSLTRWGPESENDAGARALSAGDGEVLSSPAHGPVGDVKDGVGLEEGVEDHLSDGGRGVDNGVDGDKR